MRTVRQLVTRYAVATAAGLMMVAAAAAPATAHVTVDPPQAAQGDTSVRVVFLAPTEGQDASTTGLEVHLPEDVPIVGVATVPVPGWSVEVTREDLDEPVVDHHGAEITNAVSSIAWTADSEDAAIAPGEAGEFPVVFGMVPEVDQLVFRALQHYSDGEVVRWIERPEPDGGEPHHPAPVLELLPAGTGDGAGAAASADQAAAGEDSTTGGGAGDAAAGSPAAIWIGLAGLAAGLAALALGGVAFVRSQAAGGAAADADRSAAAGADR